MASYVYILASKIAGTLYTGVTSDLVQRVSQHKMATMKGFTKKYDVKKLVWYEVHEDIEQAIIREKQIKEWQRSWKIRMIEEHNPEWTDLFEEMTR